MHEAELGRKIQVALCKAGARIWRNNIAIAWASNNVKHFTAQQCITIQVGPGDVLLRNARPIHSGLCDGSSDFIGIYNGRFLAVEVKTLRGRTTEIQDDFISMINKHGGIAFVARDPEESVDTLKKLS